MKDIKHVLECQTWHRIMLIWYWSSSLDYWPSQVLTSGSSTHSVAAGSHQRWETLLATHTSYQVETLTPQAGSTLDLFSFEWFLEREIQKKKKIKIKCAFGENIARSNKQTV